jgi:hypothetical protein
VRLGKQSGASKKYPQFAAGIFMHVWGQNRDQATLFPERLDDLIAEDNAKMALAVTAYNLTRAINVLSTRKLCQALAT